MLTASYLHGASLPVHGVELQVHWAGQGQGHPETKQLTNLHGTSLPVHGVELQVHRAGQGQGHPETKFYLKGTHHPSYSSSISIFP